MCVVKFEGGEQEHRVVYDPYGTCNGRLPVHSDSYIQHLTCYVVWFVAMLCIIK